MNVIIFSLLLLNLGYSFRYSHWTNRNPTFVLKAMTFDAPPRQTTSSGKKMIDKELKDNSPTDINGTIDLLYDSDCPICAMEVEFLKKRDLENKIRFTDISSADYDPKQHGNVEFAEGMRKIRAVMPDNTVITGVEVFRQTYKAIGLGWIFDITNLPIVGKAADFLYDVWAENRLRITGRGDLADILKERAATLREADPVDCDDGCAVEYD